MFFNSVYRKMISFENYVYHLDSFDILLIDCIFMFMFIYYVYFEKLCLLKMFILIFKNDVYHLDSLDILLIDCMQQRVLRLHLLNHYRDKNRDNYHDHHYCNYCDLIIIFIVIMIIITIISFESIVCNYSCKALQHWIFAYLYICISLQYCIGDLVLKKELDHLQVLIVNSHEQGRPGKFGNLRQLTNVIIFDLLQ